MQSVLLVWRVQLYYSKLVEMKLVYNDGFPKMSKAVVDVLWRNNSRAEIERQKIIVVRKKADTCRIWKAIILLLLWRHLRRIHSFSEGTRCIISFCLHKGKNHAKKPTGNYVFSEEDLFKIDFSQSFSTLLLDLLQGRPFKSFLGWKGKTFLWGKGLK